MAAILVPTSDVELGELKPVETISLRYCDEMLVIETDTEDIGTGNTVEEAVKSLHESTAGRIFLDTAEFLVVEREAVNQIERLRPRLKGNVSVCERKGEVDVTKVGEYLRAHNPSVKLKQWEKHVSLQVLEVENGRMKLKEK